MSDDLNLQKETKLAIQGLMSLKRKAQKAIPELRKILKKQSTRNPLEERGFRGLVVECLIKMEVKKIMIELTPFLLDDSLGKDTREKIAKSLGKMNIHEVIPNLIDFIKTKSLGQTILDGIYESLSKMIIKNSLSDLGKIQLNQEISHRLQLKWVENAHLIKEKTRVLILNEILKEKSIDPKLKVRAFLKLGEIRKAQVIPELKIILSDDSIDWWLKRIVIEWLGDRKIPNLNSVLLAILKDELSNIHLRCSSVKTLGKLKANEAINDFTAILQNKESEPYILHEATWKAFFEIQGDEISPELINQFFSPVIYDDILIGISAYIGKAPPKIFIHSFLLRIVRDSREFESYRYNAAKALGKFTSPELIIELQSMLSNEILHIEIIGDFHHIDNHINNNLKGNLAISLCEMEAKEAVPEVFMILQDKSIPWHLKCETLLFLCKFGNQPIKRDLLLKFGDDRLEEWVRWNIGFALYKSKVLNNLDIPRLRNIFINVEKSQSMVRNIIIRIFLEIGKREKIVIPYN